MRPLESPETGAAETPENRREIKYNLSNFNPNYIGRILQIIEEGGKKAELKNIRE